MIILDANIILRYLLDDNETLANQAEDYINRNDAIVTVEVIAEVVYVLKGIYALERERICNILKSFLKIVSCRQKNAILVALDTYRDHHLDFVDCVLYAYHLVHHCEIATFDKKLNRLMHST